MLRSTLTWSLARTWKMIFSRKAKALLPISAGCLKQCQGSRVVSVNLRTVYNWKMNIENASQITDWPLWRVCHRYIAFINQPVYNSAVWRTSYNLLNVYGYYFIRIRWPWVSVVFLAHLPLSLLKGFFHYNVNGVALTYRNVCTMIFVRAILPLPNVMYSVFQNVNANF